MTQDELLILLIKLIEDNLIKATAGLQDQMIVITIDKAELIDLLKIIKKNSNVKFTILTDLFAADFPEREKRFEIVYNLLSLKLNKRVYIKTYVAEGELIPSIYKIFNAAIWYEREAFDLYGIVFESNPDLRRILTDYGFIGYPLRKDFPLTGHVEVIYDQIKEKVVYQPITLPQEYRSFDFLSPWQGTDYKLPGDEKANINIAQNK